MTATRPRTMTVADVMSSRVITAGESATFHELADLMQRHGISAVPISDAGGKVIGIVSEADLLPKEAPQSKWHLWQRPPERAENAKAHGVTAGDVMTYPVITAYPGEELSAVARRLLDKDVKRLPVMDHSGRLVGIVSRRDVLRAFRREDEDIRLDIVDGVLPRWMGLDPSSVDVSVAGGVVLLRGGVERRSDVSILEHLVAGLDGVVSVSNELRYEFDDSHVGARAEARVH